jgi:hypothetical protein
MLIQMKKALFIVLCVSLLLLSHDLALCSSEFSTNQIEAEILITSPTDYGSYIGNVTLNVSIRFYVRSSESSSNMIPYQKVTCLYQVDNGQYQNASVYYASQQTSWADIPYNGYCSEMRCNYTASLVGLSNGLHSLKITLEPSDIAYYFVNSSAFIVPATDYFYTYQTNPAPSSTVPEFSWLLIVPLLLSMFAVAVVFRHRKTAKPSSFLG